MSKSVIHTSKAPEPIGPYNQAIESGNMLFVSGQIAIVPETGDLLTGDIVSETHQVMKNLGAILNEAGTDYDHIVKCSIFIKNMGDFGSINEAYGQYFNKNAPARETVEVSGLPKDVNVEISCIAII